MNRIIPVFLILLLVVSTPGHSQILNKLKRAAKDGVQDAVERRVEHEIQKAAQKQTDRYLQQLFGPPSQYEGTGYDYSGILNSISMDVEHADSYSFTGFTDMEISGTDERGKNIDPTIFRSFSNTSEETWAMQMDTDEKDLESTIMIFDNKNQATIMLMESKKGEKSRMAYGLDWSGMMDAAMDSDSVQQELENFEINKTGNTKTILGYECEEYKTVSDTFEALYWVSNEPIDGYASYWSKNNFLFNQQMKTKYQAYMDKMPEGDVLEISYFDKNDKGTTEMKIVDINTDHNETFIMSDYQNALAPEEK